MNCKHCQAELDEGVTLCPACGTENEIQEPEIQEEAPVAEEIASAEETAPAEEAAEQTAESEIKEGAKATPGKIALGIVAVVVVIAVLVALIAGGLGGEDSSLSATIAPTAGTVDEGAEATEATEATIPPDGNPDDVTCKGSYTVADQVAADSIDTVVATMGDAELTNGELQVYYWTEVFSFLNEYSGYAEYLGLDYYQSLDTQICGLDDTMTWQQYFLMCALDTWQSYEAMAMEGEAANFQLDAELQNYLDNVVADMEAAAASYGFANAAEMVASNVGAGSSVETYADYVTTYYKGLAYYDELYVNSIPTADEIEAYFNENEASYAEAGVSKDSGVYVDVRHILLTPEDENATTGEDGYPVYSDDAWEACRVKAQGIYDQWLAGDMTEESFAQFAMEHSVDGSASSGGLYEGVYVGQMVPNFNDWCFDAARQVGDHGLVKTEYGYHIMYFVGSQDIWYVTAEADLLNERVSVLLPDAIAKYPVEVDYSSIVLGYVSLVSE